MADLDQLYAQIPTQQIAQRLGAAENEVSSGVKTLLPVLDGGGGDNPLGDILGGLLSGRK